MVLVLCEYKRKNGVRVFCGERNGNNLLVVGFFFHGRLVRRFSGHMKGMGKSKNALRLIVGKPERNRPVEKPYALVRKIQGLCGIAVPSTAGLSMSHRKPFSTGTACDTRSAQNGNKRNAL